ncbi:unnamed protein product [Rotaria sp. Silwood2]|nr:unnamed protein product [Rotaria sp. Silwood2]
MTTEESSTVSESTPRKRQRRLRQDPQFIFENPTTNEIEMDTTSKSNKQSSIKTTTRSVQSVDENSTGVDLYEPGDIVWSKLGSFPWWPALIYRCNAEGGIYTKKLSILPAISCIKFKDALNVCVGMSTGQILLFDIRSNKPYFIKDHNYNLPIKRIDFHTQNNDYILSIDKKICKIWNQHTGKNLTSIEPDTPLNDMLNIPGSGLICLTNDSPKIFVYYIPTLGNAPKWCTFLDNITEELEEKPADTVYDDYKFLTLKELDTLGLSHLIGSDLLRAYMHGYFMDIRLYNQAKTVAEPFAFAEYRKKKLREKIDLKREKTRIPMPIVPTVNKDLAEKLLHNKNEVTMKKTKKQKTTENKETPSILKDTRFQSLFTNPDMQIDVNHENFKNIAPLVSRLNKQNVVEDESISIENDEEEREDDDNNDDDLINDILTSEEEEEEEEEEEKEKPNRKTKLIPIDAINDTDQETIRSLSFSERTKRTIDSSSSHLHHQNQIIPSNKNNRKETNDDYRKNVRRAPRSRMNGRHKET